VALFDLPAITNAKQPAFSDRKSCKEWLKDQPLTNVIETQPRLREQLMAQNRCDVPVEDRLECLEALRETVSFVQTECAKRFINKALPLTYNELVMFRDVIELWREMSIGYRRIVQAAVDCNPKAAEHVALICQRALRYLQLAMLDHYRAYQQFSDDYWQALHEMLAAAEKLTVVHDRVSDSIDREYPQSSPLAVYSEVALLHLASPNELSLRQIGQIARWLQRWALKTELSVSPAANSDTPPIWLDLAAQTGPGLQKKSVVTERCLEVSDIAHSLKKRIIRLRQGASPTELNLGEDCIQPGCEQFLVLLYRNWCEKRPPRVQSRRSVSAEVETAGGINAIHYYLSGHVFKQPNTQRELTQKQREEIATFGRIATRDDTDEGKHGFMLETWRILDESIGGFRLSRAFDNPGGRYLGNQLLALRPQGASGFMLGSVRWLAMEPNHDLNAGVSIIPGALQPLSFRAAGLNAVTEKFTQGILLAANLALQSPEAVILPMGWFKPKRMLEIVYLEEAKQIRLSALLERGSDFERISFEWV
jgi:cyclic-di-GMP-binding protein